MPDSLYHRTALTPLRAAQATGFIDWSMQPSLFKRYPDALFGYDVDTCEALQTIALARCVTSEQEIGGRPYRRLNTPSAGNLHPIELYVQIRGIKGVIGGIYHVDARRNRIVLLKEVEGEGLEPLVGISGRLKGMLFVMSVVPFRSIWKYGERAWRYCYLDAGHQLGALQAAAVATTQQLTILSGFDADRLGSVMGFGGEEYIAAAATVGRVDPRSCDALETPLMRVQPTDYCDDPKGMMAAFGPGDASGVCLGAEVRATPEQILTRRSTRRFAPTPLAEEDLEWFMQNAQQPPQPLVCHSFVLRGEALKPGLYEGSRLVREGMFHDLVASLLVDQRFVSTSSLVLIVSASAFCADTLITAGSFAHSLHLHAQINRLGFSGVGAFYDRKLQKFLDTDNYILYALVIGHDHDKGTS